MPQEDVELVRDMYAAFHGGDAEGALSYFDDEVVVDATIRVDGGVAGGAITRMTLYRRPAEALAAAGQRA